MSANNLTTDLSDAGARAARTWRAPLGRAGLVAKGALYIVLGLLAVQFARGETSSKNVTQQGAFETVADQPLGSFLMVLMILGLLALVAWHVIQAFTGDPVEGDEAGDRVKYAAKAVIYGAIAVTAVKVLLDDTTQGGGGDQQPRQASKALLDLPGGTLLVGLVGVVLIGIALYQVKKYVIDRDFMERLSPPEGTRRAVEVGGQFGYAARAVVAGISGAFFIVAAIQHDPKESKGISGAVQELASHAWGQVVLWMVAIGLCMFGVFCLFEAKFRTAA